MMTEERWSFGVLTTKRILKAWLSLNVFKKKETVLRGDILL